MRKQLKYILKQLSLAYDWLFDELTRPIEMLSSISMFLFSFNLLLNSTEITAPTIKSGNIKIEYRLLNSSRGVWYCVVRRLY